MRLNRIAEPRRVLWRSPPSNHSSHSSFSATTKPTRRLKSPSAVRSVYTTGRRSDLLRERKAEDPAFARQRDILLATHHVSHRGGAPVLARFKVPHRNTALRVERRKRSARFAEEQQLARSPQQTRA